MKQEEKDKELLLIDLSARLPYGVILLSPNGKVIYQTDGNTAAELLVEEGWKPYLRSMSSITEEEISDLRKINSQFWFDTLNSFAYVAAADDGFCSVEQMDNILNYLNSKHFDYRGLIEKGLALEAPEGMYK